MRTQNHLIPKNIALILGLVVIFLFSAAGLSAQAPPEGFNYQGVVRDNGNLLPNTAVTVSAKIRQTSPAGTVVYNENHVVNTNDYGVFSLEVGAGAVVTGTFSNINWGSDDYYLDISIDFGGGFQAFGATQLVSVPYALYAKNGSKWANNGNNIYFNTGNVGIGVTSPANRLTIDSAIAIVNGGEYFSFGLTPTGEMGFFPNTTALTGTPVLWLDDNTSRVAIGNSSPSDKLHITGGGVKIDQTSTTPNPGTVYGNSMPMAYGSVVGTIINTDFGVTAVTNTVPGVYTIELDNNYSGVPVVIATSYNNGTNDEVVTYSYTSPNIVIIQIADGTGAGVGSNFSFVVFGTPQ